MGAVGAASQRQSTVFPVNPIFPIGQARKMLPDTPGGADLRPVFTVGVWGFHSVEGLARGFFAMVAHIITFPVSSTSG